jgi:hypothetical protein
MRRIAGIRLGVGPRAVAAGLARAEYCDARPAQACYDEAGS